jgi:ABC-type transporter Mla MlaB component
MLKVTTKEQSGSFTLVLEGRLCRPWTAEAERGWSYIESSAGDAEVLLDLAGVTFLDQDGEALLTSILESGARIRAGGLLVSHVVEQIRERILQKSGRLSRGTPKLHRSPGVL